MVKCGLNRNMRCKKTPYPFSTRRVKHSPFKRMANAKKTLRAHRAGKSIGFTARSSLKSMGVLPRSSGCYQLGQKYLS